MKTEQLRKHLPPIDPIISKNKMHNVRLSKDGQYYTVVWRKA